VAVDPLSCAQNLAALAGLGEPATRPIERSIIAVVSANLELDISSLPVKIMILATNLANATPPAQPIADRMNPA
jgi:hypothetical protein